MACLSPSPSGRRLSELLEEQQEPFFLDIHLLEKGCSSRLLEGYDTALCWPAPGNDAAAVLKRLTSKKNKAATSRGGKKHQHQQQQPAGILKLLLSKILHGKAARRKPAVLQFSDSFKVANAVAPAPCADHLNAVKTAAEVKEEAECSDSDSDSYSDDEKQLSPVSVLEHPFGSSLVHGKLSHNDGKLSPSKNSMDAFQALLDAAYSPALLVKSDDLIKDTAAAEDHNEEDEYCYGYRTSPKNSRYDDAAYWEVHRAELARVSELVASEVPNARLDAAAAVQPEREDVGAGVAAAVLESLLQDLLVDLGRC